MKSLLTHRADLIRLHKALRAEEHGLECQQVVVEELRAQVDLLTRQIARAEHHGLAKFDAERWLIHVRGSEG